MFGMDIYATVWQLVFLEGVSRREVARRLGISRDTVRKMCWVPEEVLPLPKKPQKLPIILGPEEVQHFLGCVLDVKHHAILTTCYAAGLRISEAVQLKSTDIDSQRMVIRVEQGNRYRVLRPKAQQTAWSTPA